MPASKSTARSATEERSRCQVLLLPAPSKPEITQVHRWTHDGSKVLLVKCVNADMTSGLDGKFVWPKSGPVKSDVRFGGAMPSLAPHRLVIARDDDADLYRAVFARHHALSGVDVSTLCASLADLDENGVILNNWRIFLDLLLRDCMVDMTGYPREQIRIERIGLESVAHLAESA